MLTIIAEHPTTDYNGKPSKRYELEGQVDGIPSQKFSAFSGPWTEDWRVGLQVDIKPEQVTTKQKGDRTFYNVNAPDSKKVKEAQLEQKLDRILNGITTIYQQNEQIKALLKQKPSVEDLAKKFGGEVQ